MREIDQFIDEVLFKESDQYKLIYEQVEKTLEYNGLIPLPYNKGVMAEYCVAVELYKNLKEKNIKSKLTFLTSYSKKYSINVDEINDAIDAFVKQNDIKNLSVIKANAKRFVENIHNNERFTENFNNNDFKLREISLIGQASFDKNFITSADIELITDKNISLRVSLKRGSNNIYKFGKLDSEFDKKSEDPFKIASQTGGGIEKLYALFDLDFNKLDIEQNEKLTWNKYSEDFVSKANRKFLKKDTLKRYFDAIAAAVSRGDKGLISLTDIITKKEKSIYPDLFAKYISHITGVEHNTKKSKDLEGFELYSIVSNISKIRKFKLTPNTLPLNSAEEKVAFQLMKDAEIKNEEIYNRFINKIKSSSDKKIPKKLLPFINDYRTAKENFTTFINNSLESLITSEKQKNLFIIRFYKSEIKLESRQQLFILSNIFNTFDFIERNKEYNDLKEIFINLFKLDQQINNLKNKKINDKNIFESLILEALNEKEFNKVISKVTSANPQGFISAIPSNKTSNSIAVRFDDDDKIDAGIKKIKSKLKSSGYDLEDNRVLKFDQHRDTTDVIKNGEVVGRLFFRADIKERQGLAYEHIIGSVLTGKITSQLMNRIDLPPDASADEVNQKLNSEKFKALFDSAKKAAPIIEEKVGKIVKAESVGSTNNKADFVLTTADGKTVGLSAKYAAGEKDNEYKMNKVLGFGTEDESLVYNPKAIPWWVIGRQTFLEKLKKGTGSYSDKTYDPDYETLDAPAWMVSAKEKHPDIYKETMEEVYGQIRNILTRNLRRMKFKDLVSFVMEADLGKEEERGNYDKFIKVVDGPSGLSVTELDLNGGDIDGIDPRQLNPEQIVVQDRSDIIIKIPGFNELKINSVKFKSDMLSSKAGDLKIKTR
jgi:hypothetical protein